MTDARPLQANPLNRSRPLTELLFTDSHPAWEDCPLKFVREGEHFVLTRDAAELYGKTYAAGTPVVFAFWMMLSMYDPPEESLACFYLDRGPFLGAWDALRSLFTRKDPRTVWFRLPASSVTQS